MKVFLLATLFILTSCGGTSGSSGTDVSAHFQEPPELKNFEIIGTSSAINNVAQLNSVEGNSFKAQVKIRATDTGKGKGKGYRISLFISQDEKLDVNDIDIWRESCRGKICKGYIDYQIKCDLGSIHTGADKMKIYCESQDGSNGLGYLDNQFLNTLPKKAYILLVIYGFAGVSGDYNTHPKEVEIN